MTSHDLSNGLSNDLSDDLSNDLSDDLSHQVRSELTQSSSTGAARVRGPKGLVEGLTGVDKARGLVGSIWKPTSCLIWKEGQGPIGLDLQQGSGQCQCVTIACVKPDTPAARSVPPLVVGMTIISVDGVLVLDAHAAAAAISRVGRGHMVLEVRVPRTTRNWFARRQRPGAHREGAQNAVLGVHQDAVVSARALADAERRGEHYGTEWCDHSAIVGLGTSPARQPAAGAPAFASRGAHSPPQAAPLMKTCCCSPSIYGTNGTSPSTASESSELDSDAISSELEMSLGSSAFSPSAAPSAAPSAVPSAVSSYGRTSDARRALSRTTNASVNATSVNATTNARSELHRCERHHGCEIQITRC
jgi:hypothetical protein